MIRILTDSCSDLTKELRTKYAIDYVKMNTSYNGKEQPASLDWEYYSPKELYDIMRGGDRVFTTQVPQNEYEEYFTKALESGDDVVYVSCSGKLSASVNMARKVASDLLAKYPNGKIVIVDSFNACMGEGMIAIEAAKSRDKGMSADEIGEHLEKVKLKFNQFCAVNSLTTLRKAGRVKGPAAFFGNLFGVKPIIISDKYGNNYPIKKIKGRMNSLDEIVNLTKETVEDKDIVYIVHADCEDDAKLLKEKILQNIPDIKEVYISYIGPIIGASTGPDTIAIYSYGKEVTVGAEE